MKVYIIILKIPYDKRRSSKLSKTNRRPSVKRYKRLAGVVIPVNDHFMEYEAISAW